jgi:gliding motility-associated-like protein
MPVAFRDNSQLNGAIIQNWYWNVNDSIYAQTMDTSITFYVGTSFQVTHALTSDLGCTDTTFLNYLITDEIIKVNVMTPNGDGVNDYLVIPNIQKYPNNSLRIYNRWGVEVAFFKPYRNNWDAYFVSDGVYFYVIELEQGAPALKGNITVIK